MTAVVEREGPTAAPEVPERPALASGVVLAGAMPGTGFASQPWLIERDGEFLQVTELLYRVAEQIDGERTLDAIAAELTASTEWAVTPDNVRQLLAAKLIPLRLVRTASGETAPRADEDRSPLQIKMRRRVLEPALIDRVTGVLRHLYAPPALVPLLLVVGFAYAWLYLVRGVSDAFRAALYTPGGLLVVLAVAAASGIVHEFGHAAALRYGGGRVRGMGVGLYIIYPTFYTDTTDAYRLGRWARLRTDLGGIYFHLLFGLGLIGLYLVTQQELLLAIVLVISGDIVYQLIPYLRLDGYWALADLAGIPDFFSQTGPYLRSVLRLPASSGSRLPELKRPAKVAFALYIALTIPVLALLTALMLWGFPRFQATAWDALYYQTKVLSDAARAGDALLVVSVVMQMLLLALSMLARE
jgi:putative peptide zinc metalloprotease protein